MKTFTLRMDDDFHKAVKLKCVEAGVTMQEYITNLIQEDIEKEKTKK